MPETDITALLTSLHGVGKQPADSGTKDEQDTDQADQRERIELRQKAAEVGLTVHAGVDAETLKSLIIRKEFLSQHNNDTLKPAEVEKQDEAFRQLQSYGAGILEAVFTNLRTGDSVSKATETAREAFEEQALKSKLKQHSDELELAISVFEAALDAVTERLHDKSEGTE